MKKDYVAQGASAFALGHKQKHCPYDAGQPAAAQWVQGWLQARHYMKTGEDIS